MSASHNREFYWQSWVVMLRTFDCPSANLLNASLLQHPEPMFRVWGWARCQNRVVWGKAIASMNGCLRFHNHAVLARQQQAYHKALTRQQSGGAKFGLRVSPCGQRRCWCHEVSGGLLPGLAFRLIRGVCSWDDIVRRKDNPPRAKLPDLPVGALPGKA